MTICAPRCGTTIFSVVVYVKGSLYIVVSGDLPDSESLPSNTHASGAISPYPSLNGCTDCPLTNIPHDYQFV